MIIAIVGIVGFVFVWTMLALKIRKTQKSAVLTMGGSFLAATVLYCGPIVMIMSFFGSGPHSTAQAANVASSDPYALFSACYDRDITRAATCCSENGISGEKGEQYKSMKTDEIVAEVMRRRRNR